MKNNIRLLIILSILSVFLIGCSITREPMRTREEFFRPVTVIPQRNNALLSSSDIMQLKEQLELAARYAGILRDSLASLQSYTGSLLTSTRTLLDKVGDLETKEFATYSKQQELEQSVIQLQNENKQLAQQLKEIREKMITSSVPTSTQIFSPARNITSLRDEYSEGLALFSQKRYQDAHDLFNELIEKGIDEDLADNCEYWKGECSFAKKEFYSAINAFQKVLEIRSSNKKEDAYFMLGKSYEQIGDMVKARWAYEELNLLYPNNSHYRIVKYRINILNQKIPLPSSKPSYRSSI